MDFNKRNIKPILLIITFGVLLYSALAHFDVVWQGVGWFFRLILPFLVGLGMAFIINVLMRVVEEKLFRPLNRKNWRYWPKLRRPLALIVSLVGMISVVFILLFMIVPEIRNTIFLVADILPGYLDHLKGRLDAFITWLKLSPNEVPWLSFDANKAGTMVADFLRQGGQQFFNTTVGITTSILSVLFNTLLGFVFAIYVLLQKEKLSCQFKKLFYAYLPQKRVESLLSVMAISNKLFSKFVTGQLTEAVIIGVLCFLGMTVFGLPYAVMISALVGFTALIPVFGAFIGTIIGAFLILMDSPMKAFWFVVFILVLQQLEGNLIYPKVVGKSVGLPGIWVLVAVTLGGSIWGVLGMLLSVPVCSVAYCLLRQAVAKKLEQKDLAIE